MNAPVLAKVIPSYVVVIEYVPIVVTLTLIVTVLDDVRVTPKR